MTWFLGPRELHVSLNKDLVADVQTLQEENLSKKKSLDSARRLAHPVYKTVVDFSIFDLDTEHDIMCAMCIIKGHI